MIAPPGWVTRLLRAALEEGDANLVINDLAELYAHRVQRDGRARANRWYIRQALGCAFHLRMDGVLRPRPYADGGGEGTFTRAARAIRELPHDVRLATRSLLRRPSYVMTVALTLGLGLSGLSVVYSVAWWVLLRPVPGVAAQDELAIAQVEFNNGGGSPGGAGFPFSHVDAVEITARSKHLATFTVLTPHEVHFAAGRNVNAERIAAEVVWPNYFEVLGTRLQHGRTLRADSLQAVAVISDRLARRFWGKARDAVGSTVSINGSSFTVVGVAPKEFHGTKVPGVSDIWLPAATLPALVHTPTILTDPMAQVWTNVIMRRKEGVTAARAAEAMNSTIPLITSSRREHSFMAPMSFQGYEGIGLPVPQRAGVARTLRVVGVAALALLLLTCANVANLGLTRSASTSANTAVRRALGSSASRIFRERLLESLLLGATGAALGVGLSALALRLMRQTALSRSGISLEGIHLQQWVVVASVITALAAALMAGVVPAFLALRTRGSMLLHSARAGTVRSYRIRSSLVVAQVALSIVLVVWSGLLARTTWNLRNIDFGFDTRNVVQFSLDSELQGYDEARTAAFLRNLISELEKQPGVRAAAVMDHGVFDQFTFPANIQVDKTLPDAKVRERVYTRRVQMSPALLDALGVPLVAGRVFTTEWLVRNETATRVGMLNESALEHFLPGVTPEQAIGRTIMLEEQTTVPVTITGVVKDARLSDLEGREPLVFFQPWSQGWKTGQFTVFVRGRGDRSALTSSIRDVVRSLDPGLPVYGLGTLADRVDEQIAEQRFVANLAIALAVTGIVLSMLGLYGTLSYMVLERTREIGVRAALGARPATLISRVVESGLTHAAVGVVIGVCTSLYLSHFIAARLYGITPFDGGTYLVGVLFVFVVAAVASAVPARRAAAIDPMNALRHD